MIRLKNYTPKEYDILLKVSHTATSPKGIIMPTPQKDMIMEVLKVGGSVENVTAGQHVLVLSGGGYELPMIDESGKQILTVQVQVHNVAGTYVKDDDENNVFLINEQGEAIEDEDKPGPSNIIDNPGIEHSPFLKEEIKA